MAANIKISFEMMQEFDKLLLMISELEEAMLQIVNSANLLDEEVTVEFAYEGKAKKEMKKFYECCSNHTLTLINLYSKAYQFALNAIIDMIEQDKILARALQRGDAKW